MSMTQEISAEADFLLVKAKGTFSLEEAQRTFLEMLEAVARHKVTKVFVDGREVKGEPQTMERFYYGEFAANAVGNFAKCGVSLATQFAYVLQEPVLDPNRFGETVAVNRGMLIKVCSNPEEACGWLQIARARNPDDSGSK